MPSVWDIVFSRKEHTNWFSNTKWSGLKTTIQVALYRLIKFYLGMNIYTHAYTWTIKDKKKLWIWKRARKVICEGLEERKGKEKWCKYNLENKRKCIKCIKRSLSFLRYILYFNAIDFKIGNVYYSFPVFTKKVFQHYKSDI